MLCLRGLKITPELLQLIATIDEFKGSWRSLTTLAPDRLSTLRHVATVDSIGSSTRIEGSQLGDGEVEELLTQLKWKRLTTRDEQEVAGYSDVMDLVFTSFADISPSQNHIKQLHSQLLVHRKKDSWHRGAYKTSPNHVAAFDEFGNKVGVLLEAASPFLTPARMTELVNWFEEELREKTWHPLLLIGTWVVVFLEIHPFQDGNGRLSRILTTLLLLRAGYAHVSYSSLEAVIESNKARYYVALRKTQATIRMDKPNWQPWLTFFLRALAEQVRRLTKKIERENLVRPPLPPLSLAILDFAREHGQFSIGDMLRLTQSNRNTLKLHLRNLVQLEYLRVSGKGRGVRYELARHSFPS
jgi:Fic family protein